jgi:uncharacterized membrane protein YbhN (UPF0104 family)
MPHEGTQRLPAARAAWPHVKRVLTWAFFAVVVWLIVRQARTIDWPQVLVAVRRYEVTTLFLAAALAACSHLMYSTYDLIGRRITGHRLPRPQVMAIAAVSYAFNLNFGALIGGVAFRYRLYSRSGLDNPTITAVLGVSVATNWLGYLLLGGAVALWHPLELPEDWRIGSTALRALGLVLVFVPLGYLLMAWKSKRRQWTLRGRELTLPKLRFALLEVVLSTVNWSVIAAVLFVLFEFRIDYASVLGVLLLAAVAGVITHVPAGLGVLEAVFIALLAPPFTVPELIGILLTYRALYYLAPLLVALMLFAALEARSRRKR